MAAQHRHLEIMKLLIYIYVFHCMQHFLCGLDNALPEDIQRQMFEYALKLDQIRKSFETGKVDAIGNVKRLGGVHNNGNVDVVKKVSKLGALNNVHRMSKLNAKRINQNQVKDQCREAEQALEMLMKKLDANGFILAQTLLSLDLLSLRNLLDRQNLDLNKVPALINKLDESRKQVEEELKGFNGSDFGDSS